VNGLGFVLLVGLSVLSGVLWVRYCRLSEELDRYRWAHARFVKDSRR
jgi:hypothetical protein